MPSYTYTLDADDCPTPISPGAQTLLQANLGTPVVSESFAVGQIDGVVDGLNEVSTRVDLAGRFGGGTYGIVKGLALDQTTNGFVDVGAGQAMIDGIVEKTAMVQTAVSAGTTGWVFLTRAGGISIPTGGTFPAAPASQCVYLGQIVVDGSGVITSYDLSGVTYLRGGIGWRRVADTAKPADAGVLPATGLFYTRTAEALWLWDGVGYVLAGIHTQDSGWTTFTNLSTDRTCDANATTVDELADILGTLIVKLKAKGVIDA
jgi:hypothetical protein